MTRIPALRTLFSELVAQPSVSCADPALDMSNRGAAECLAGWLETLGFSCELLPLPDNPDKLNLLASLGRGKDGLVLAGHLDTVPFDADQWHSDPFRLTERDGRLYGLGTSDMKGFLAIATDVAREYRAGEFKAPLVLLASADEECGMDGARALAESGRLPGRHAVIGEPTGLQPIRRHKGIFMETIRVIGASGHSSDPAHGANAICGMHQVLTAIEAFRGELRQRGGGEDFRVPHATLNPGVIRGGDSPNRIPARCELQVDLRFLPGMEIAELRAELRQRARQALTDSDCGIEFSELFAGTPAFETDAQAQIVQAAEKLTGAPAAAVDFATEGAFYNDMGMETVILGPGDIAQAHQPDEYLALDRIEPMREILHGLIRRFCLQAA